MKKVLALVLAVMMLATVAVAAEDLTSGGEDNAKYKASVTPGTTIKIDQKDGITDHGTATVLVINPRTDDVITYSKDPDVKDTGFQSGRQPKDTGEPKDESYGGVALQALDTTDGSYDVTDILFRAVTNENYSVSGVKSRIGRSLVKGVTINDKEERVEVKLVDDLNNTTTKDFEVSFTLKGKGKMTLKSQDETDLYNVYTGLSEVDTNSGKVVDGKNAKTKGERVTLPSVKFNFIGTVGYGKVVIYLGNDVDEDLEDMDRVQHVKLNDDVVKFERGNNIGDWKRISGYPAAGAFTADAILTQHYEEGLTLEARVYSGDTLHFGISHTPTDIVGRLADSDADMDFFFFNSDKAFTTFNSNVKLYFNDADENDYVYRVKDGKLIPDGKYDEEEGCWVVKTRTLGQYIVSDVELKEFEAAADEPVDGNPDTGANDVVGIATALAAVALVSAAAVSLKK